MRTVAFSNAEIVKLLNDKFICAWVNKRPDLKFKDDLYPAGWKPRGLPNGAAVANVTSVFAAADGTVIHAVPGMLDAAGFRRHAEFAQELHGMLSDLKREDRAGHYAKAHARAAKESKCHVEAGAHTRLAGRYMRVDEMPLDYFDLQGRAYV